MPSQRRAREQAATAARPIRARGAGGQGGGCFTAPFAAPLRAAEHANDRKPRARGLRRADARGSVRRLGARAPGARQGASESPLEASLLRAFFDAGFRPLAALSEIVVARSAHGLLLQQLPVSTPAARYRLDFALMHPGNGVFLAIEVDGREFHDRTTEQGRRDRQRDRALTAAGWTVVRFSGSEIFRDAARCVREVLSLASSGRVPRFVGGRP